MVNGKTKKTAFPAKWTERHRNILAYAKLGLLRVVEKSSKWYVQISIGVKTPIK
jgi:hypothetical protein